MTQHGVCLDALNPSGRPSNTKLHNLGVDSYRMEIRSGDAWLEYYMNIQSFGQYLLYGPSTEDFVSVLKGLTKRQPEVIILGNEPDSYGDSSWTMSPQQYIDFWNTNAPYVKQLCPSTKLCVAGMLGATTKYLMSILSHLNPQPDMINKHYPNSQQELNVFQHHARLPLIVGEWCYKTGTQSQVNQWQWVLDQWCISTHWFCWSDAMVPDMGLVSIKGRQLATYRNYKKAIT